MEYGKIQLNNVNGLLNEIITVDSNGFIVGSNSLSGAGGGIDSLTDVNITSVQTSDIISYDGTSWKNEGPGEFDIFICRDVKADATNGGTFTSGAWRTRALNTVVISQDWASLSSNQITLNEVGTYLMEGQAIAYAVDKVKSRFALISGTGTSSIDGTNSAASYANYGTESSYVCGIVTVTAAPAVYELQHRCETTERFSTAGFGQSDLMTLGSEIYSQVRIIRIE